MRLFHFSETAWIDLFKPRPVQTPSPRPQGQEWLNGPLIWAIDEEFSFLYLFPRDCPRIIVWATPETTRPDRNRWMGQTDARAIAYVETGWLSRLPGTVLYRYELSPAAFIDLKDAGMWVSPETVRPLSVSVLTDIPGHLVAACVELRRVDDLSSLKPVWDTTLHASGIRLRNARNWVD